ncbi:MAG: glyoxalase [Frankiales bacterium]|nr:glyoxalase [Frankiales bacterium]
MSTPWSMTIDTRDASGQVTFWCLALGYEPEPAPAGHGTWREWYLSVGVPEEELEEGDCCDRIRDPEGRRPGIWFQPVPEEKELKNRIHLDLRVGGGREVPLEDRIPLVDAKVAELIAAGASQLRGLSGMAGHYAFVLQDPEGNEFCVT